MKTNPLAVLYPCRDGPRGPSPLSLPVQEFALHRAYLNSAQMVTVSVPARVFCVTPPSST